MRPKDDQRAGLLSLPHLGIFAIHTRFLKFKLIYIAPEAQDNVCEQLVQGRARQCSGWDWIRDLQSQVERPNHCASEPQNEVSRGVRFALSDKTLIR